MSKKKSVSKKKYKEPPPLNLRKLIMTHMKKFPGVIEEGKFDDKSSSWIEYKKSAEPGIIVSLSFNYEGTELEMIEVHKEIVKVVDQQKLF
jgi:hypothetical protein